MAITLEFIRGIDWTKTPIGPMERWPLTLRRYVDLILGLTTPAIVFWGPELIQIYNDGYSYILGPRHPRGYGGAYRDVWPDTYPLIMPWMRQVLDEGKCVEVARAPITLTRHGFTEETWFTFTLSPLRDDEGKIAGVYQPVVEMTDLVLRERRAETLRLLTSRGEALAQSRTALEANDKDVPLAGIYLWSDVEQGLRLASQVGFASLAESERALRPLHRAVSEVFAGNSAVEATLRLETKAWPEPVEQLFIAPLRRLPGDPPAGVIAFALSPRLRFDAAYRDFLEAAARELGSNLVAQRAEQVRLEWVAREEAARYEAEALQDAQSRRMAALFEHAPVGIAVLTGPEHVYEVSNPLYAALLPNRSILGLGIRDALPELKGQGIYELLDAVYTTGEPFVGRSIRLMVDRGDGVQQERFFDFVYQPMPGPDGNTESIIVVIFEVTELARARRDAESANRVKDEFFAILGHELRNPLAPITTALQLMRLRGEQVLVKERTIIERQVGQITRLVDDLLDVARITRGKVALEKKPVEMFAAVTKGIEQASPLLEQRRHHLAVDVPRTGLIVDGDEGRLAQVVANLLTNAAKYTEPGGRVRVSTEKRAQSVVLRVEDNGIGIAASMLPRVFAPFAQEQQALDRAQGGLGLGLTIVESLVKLHGGEVSVQSAGLGQGSTFTLELPLAKAAPAPRPGGSSPGVKRAQVRKRVLVVDDNEDGAGMLAEALKVLGYETRIALDGAEALRALETFAPQIALLDIGLPVMDGYELALRMRKSTTVDKLLLFAVTGYGQAADKARAAAAGFDAHLVKPVQLDKLAGLLASHEGPA